jgi:predicted Ser/Thr protein kinase
MFGRYRLHRLLGEGGMGTVYLAHDTQLDRPVALKVPRFGAGDGQQARERFLREARAAATMHHANLCPVYDVGEIDGTLFLTMAFLEGRALADVIRANRKQLPQRQVAALVRKLALALAEAHRKKVIHRDLKPGNIMLNPRGEPIIMDFGLARRGGRPDPSATLAGIPQGRAAQPPKDAQLTRIGQIMGTPGYMAPEQAQGNPDAIGYSCDIYSLGVILYQLLTGRLPFRGDTFTVLSRLLTDEPEPPSAHRPDLDPRLEAICLQAMAKKPEQRQATMTDLAAALTEYLKTANRPAAEEAERSASGADLPFAVDESPAEALPPRQRGFLVWAGLVLAAVSVVLVGLCGWLLVSRTGGRTSGPSDLHAEAVHRADPQVKPAAPAVEKPGAPAHKAPTPAPTPPELLWPAEDLRAGRIDAPDLSRVPAWFTDNFKDRTSGMPVDGARGYWESGYFIHGAGNRELATAPLPLGRANPPNPRGDFACEVVGKVSGPNSRWGLFISEAGKPRFFVTLSAQGAVYMRPGTSAPRQLASTHPAIKKGAKGKGVRNTLLIVVRGRYLEVYVNGKAVCHPVVLDEATATAQISLLCAGGRTRGADAEFESIVVKPAGSLAPAEQRGAMRKGQ